MPYGVIHPDGALANSEMDFRMASERALKAHNLRMGNDEFDGPDFLKCVRTNKCVPADTNI